MVENFGLHLKHERELRGVSLEEIAESTRIHIRYLEALESNEFDDMPGEVFVKGYIRSYARVIGSDSEEMVNVYDEAVGKDRKKELEKVAGSSEKASSGNKKAAGYALLGIVLIALSVFGYNVVDGIIDKNKKQQAKLSLKEETPAKEEALKVPAEISPPEISENNISEKQTEEPPKENIQNASSSVSASTESPKESPEENPVPPVPTDSTPENTGEAGNPSETVKIKESNQQEAEDAKPEESEPQVKVNAQPEIAVNPLESQEDKKEDPKTPIEPAVIEKNPHSTEKPVIIQQVMGNSAGPVLPGQNLSETNDKPLHLKIQVQGNSWFNVTVDNDKEEDFILPGGSSKNVYGVEKIQLTIGNRNGTELFLNERPIDLPPGSSDVIRNFDITANLLE
jgi:cytoskeleton protein RodZ